MIWDPVPPTVGPCPLDNRCSVLIIGDGVISESPLVSCSGTDGGRTPVQVMCLYQINRLWGGTPSVLRCALEGLESPGGGKIIAGGDKKKKYKNLRSEKKEQTEREHNHSWKRTQRG